MSNKKFKFNTEYYEFTNRKNMLKKLRLMLVDMDNIIKH